MGYSGEPVRVAAAVRKGLIDTNPFGDQAATIQANPERFHFVGRADAEKILAALPGR